MHTPALISVRRSLRGSGQRHRLDLPWSFAASLIRLSGGSTSGVVKWVGQFEVLPPTYHCQHGVTFIVILIAWLKTDGLCPPIFFTKRRKAKREWWWWWCGGEGWGGSRPIWVLFVLLHSGSQWTCSEDTRVCPFKIWSVLCGMEWGVGCSLQLKFRTVRIDLVVPIGSPRSSTKTREDKISLMNI